MVCRRDNEYTYMKKHKTYTAEFKFKVALEAITNGNTAEVARRYGITGGLLSKWRVQLEKHGHLAFGATPEQGTTVLKKKVAKLEQLVGQKEVELNMIKNFASFYEFEDGT